MGEMKSAFEKAMEKIADLEKASPDELRRMEYVPKGNTLAAQYLAGECQDLRTELGQYDVEYKEYLKEGVEKTLLRNIVLPQSERDKATNKKAMQGIVALKKDSARIKNVFVKIEQLCEYYEQTLQHTFNQLRKSFEGRLEEAKANLERETGRKVDVTVESQPQFQEEWRLVMVELNLKYEEVLSDHKMEIQRIR